MQIFKCLLSSCRNLNTKCNCIALYILNLFNFHNCYKQARFITKVMIFWKNHFIFWILHRRHANIKERLYVKHTILIKVNGLFLNKHKLNLFFFFYTFAFLRILKVFFFSCVFKKLNDILTQIIYYYLTILP